MIRMPEDGRWVQDASAVRDNGFRGRQMSGSIYLSVVIPVRNEEPRIGQTLEAIARQDYPKDRYEILVVDGRSTDRSRAVAERFALEHPDMNVRLLDNPAEWSSAARNIGVRAAQGELILIVDGRKSVV